MSNYIVFDLEWNQASSKNKEIKEIIFEIIEIGAVKLNEDKEVIGTFSSLIKPQVYKTMHHMTKKIVHLDIRDLEGEASFEEVMERFRSWCGEDYIFCSWGNLDTTELQRNIAYYNMEPLCDGPLKYLDIQKLFSMECEDSKVRRSLEYGAEYFDVKKHGEFHRALSDAYYTADIFRRLENRELEKYVSYDTFHLPKSKEKELFIQFPTYTKHISRAFENKHMAMTDKEIISLRCNICGKNAKKIVNWFSPNGSRYYLCIGTCPAHGYLKGKARVKKLDDERVYIVKTIKRISKATVDDIVQKYNKAKAYAEALKKKSNKN